MYGCVLQDDHGNVIKVNTERCFLCIVCIVRCIVD